MTNLGDIIDSFALKYEENHTITRNMNSSYEVDNLKEQITAFLTKEIDYLGTIWELGVEPKTGKEVVEWIQFKDHPLMENLKARLGLGDTKC